MINKRHSFQLSLQNILKDLSLRGKWPDLSIGLKFQNENITRNYIDSYWKYLFQIIYTKLPESHDTVPQLIDCLKTMKIHQLNEMIYSIIYLSLSKNMFEFGCSFLQMYHLTTSYDSKQNICNLVSLLNGELQYVKWKKYTKNNRDDYCEKIEEKNTFQFQIFVDDLYLSDNHVRKLKEIYIHYDKLSELEILLTKYSSKNSFYINAQKNLFEYYLKCNNKYSTNLFKYIAKLNPSDSLILSYLKYLNDDLLAIDLLFDMLDYFQWKFCKECWTYLNHFLLNSTKSDLIKNCIMENWIIRKRYWMAYHFDSKGKKNQSICLLKFNIAILLLGESNFKLYYMFHRNC